MTERRSEQASGSSVDGFTAEILRGYLIGTVREMVATTTRTAFSTCFAQGEDFTCALFDPVGRMVAQDQGVPVHAGALEEAVRHVISTAGTVVPGDVFLHNDPYNWGTHQADGLVCRPIFVDGELSGYAANRGHWSDIGGMAPGGWSGDAVEVVQEGLLLPTIRLYRGGELAADVLALLRANVRMSNQLWGDIQAQIASNVVAERRIRSLVDRYGSEGLRSAYTAAMDYSRRRFESALDGIADGTAEAEDVLEDDARGNGPFRIKVRLTKSDTGVIVDFAGSDAQAKAPINSTKACTKAAVVAAVVAVCDPGLPLTSALTEQIQIRTESGTIVDPEPPAPTFGATADPAARVSQVVLSALAELASARVPAGAYATGQNLTGSTGGDDASALWYSYQSGGCGARPDRDGNSAEWHLMGNSKNESMEVWETRYPVEFLGYGLIPDSGGRGRWRGGLGTERQIRVLEPTRISAIADHHRIGAVGRESGESGLPNGFVIERDGERRSVEDFAGLASPSKFANVQLAAGDVLISIQGGGGGFGDPAKRPGELHDEDLRLGYVTEEGAPRGSSEQSVPSGITER